MAGRGHHEGRLCRCDRADGGCAGLAVRRLSPERVWELAEELWTASCGELLPARPVLVDPRSWTFPLRDSAGEFTRVMAPVAVVRGGRPSCRRAGCR
jgi:hypothetical protein